MNKPIRVGIVGANAERGWAKDAHIPALKKIQNAEIVAVSARDSASAKRAADEFGVKLAFSDSLELTRCPEVDLVSVTVKVPEHYQIVMSALKEGKHVYCEWPLGKDLGEATAMAATARDAGVHVIIGLQGCMSPAVCRALELIKSDAIGKPLTLRVFSPTAGWGASAPSFYRYLNDKSTGATLSTITGGHTLALMELLVGQFKELDARTSILHPQVKIHGSDEMITRTCSDHVLVIARHATGCISTLEVSGGQSVETPFLLELTGTRGTLALTSNHPGGFQVGNMGLIFNGQPDTSFNQIIPDLQGPPANVAENYSRLIRDIQENTFTVPDFDVAVNLTRLLDAIDKSSADGRRQFNW